MKRALWGVFALLLSVPALAQQKEGAKGEIRVYIADKDKKSVDLKDVTGTLLLEPKGGAKKTLKLELVTPKGDKKTGIGHGGEVQEADGYHVELVVVKPPGADDKKDHDHDADATPYLKAETDLKGYACGMAGHPVLDKAGKCTKCPMTAKPVDLEFSAVVIFKVKDETKNAKGFQYPSATPTSYKDAVAKIEEHLKAIDDLIKANDLDKVHKVAEKISHVCEGLPALAPKDDKAEIEKVAKEIIALFKEIDDAADAGKKPETQKVLEKYRTKVALLKKHV